MDQYHITQRDNGDWAFQRAGADRAIRVTENKQEAVQQMREFMQDKVGSVMIHRQDGSFQEERTFQRANDPRRTKG